MMTFMHFLQNMYSWNSESARLNKGYFSASLKTIKLNCAYSPGTNGCLFTAIAIASIASIPFFPATFVPNQHEEDWGLEDPVGKPMEEFRKIREIIRSKVVEMIEKAKKEELIYKWRFWKGNF